MAKYCSKCGKQMEDDAVFCSKCGTSFNKVEEANETESNTDGVNGQAIAGFILAFVFPFLGLVFSASGLTVAKRLNGRSRGLATAGMIISSINLFIQVIYFIILANEL